MVNFLFAFKSNTDPANIGINFVYKFCRGNNTTPRTRNINDLYIADTTKEHTCVVGLLQTIVKILTRQISLEG